MARHRRLAPRGLLDEFGRLLRELRRHAGNPSYQELATETGYAAETLSAAASGRQLPPLTVTLAYVSACGGDVAGWADRWRALAARTGWADRTVPTDPAPPFIWRRAGHRRTRVLLGLASLVVIAAGGALLVERTSAGAGAVPQPPPLDTAVRSSTPESSPAGPPPDYRAVAGPGCPMDFTRQTTVSSAPGDDGWHEVRGGSWTADGCDDRFLSSDLIYDPDQPQHPENHFQWRFILDAPATRRCQIEVYLPDSTEASAPTWYDVADRFENLEVTIGRFVIDQRANRGRWVNAATVAVSTAAVLVEIGGDGEGLSPGRSAMAAGPIRLTCSRT